MAKKRKAWPSDRLANSLNQVTSPSDRRTDERTDGLTGRRSSWQQMFCRTPFTLPLLQLDRRPQFGHLSHRFVIFFFSLLLLSLQCYNFMARTRRWFPWPTGYDSSRSLGSGLVSSRPMKTYDDCEAGALMAALWGSKFSTLEGKCKLVEELTM